MSDYHSGGGESIQLPQSGLIVKEGALLRQVKDAVVGRHPLEDIMDVAIKSEVNGVVIGMAVLAAGGAGACHFVESPLWSWVGMLGLGILALVLLLGVKTNVLVLRLRQGEIRYELIESLPDCQGFVMTLKGMIGRR